MSSILLTCRIHLYALVRWNTSCLYIQPIEYFLKPCAHCMSTLKRGNLSSNLARSERTGALLQLKKKKKNTTQKKEEDLRQTVCVLWLLHCLHCLVPYSAKISTMSFELACTSIVCVTIRKLTARALLSTCILTTGLCSSHSYSMQQCM